MRIEPFRSRVRRDSADFQPLASRQRTNLLSGVRGRCIRSGVLLPPQRLPRDADHRRLPPRSQPDVRMPRPDADAHGGDGKKPDVDAEQGEAKGRDSRFHGAGAAPSTTERRLRKNTVIDTGT